MKAGPDLTAHRVRSDVEYAHNDLSTLCIGCLMHAFVFFSVYSRGRGWCPGSLFLHLDV